MSDLTVYEKPTCTTCRKLAALLTERGIDFERVNYHVDALPKRKIRDLLRKSGMTAHEAARRKEPLYEEIDGDSLSEDELIERMAENPILLERPIVERGDRAVLARPVERVEEIL